MNSLPTSIEELKLILNNSSISKEERKRIKRKIYKKEYALKNPEKVKEWKKKHSSVYMKKYLSHEKNKEKLALNRKKWKIKNKHKIRDYNRKRRGLEECYYRPCLSGNKIVAWELEWRNKQVVCCYCLKELFGKQAHVDHIIPLNRFGKHEIWNLCISCPSCNLRKRDKMPHDFIKTIEREMFNNKFEPIPRFTNFLQLFLKDQDEFFRLYFEGLRERL